MSRIFIYDSCYDTINALRHALETSGRGHVVLANAVIRPSDKQAVLVTSPVDVVGLLASTRPFPDVIIAESVEVDGGWLCGLIYDMEMSRKCSVILTGHKHSAKIKQLQELYGVSFWPKPFNVLKFVDYIESFFTVPC